MDVGLVCDACSALTPIGVPQCTRCGAEVALDPRPRAKSKPASVAQVAGSECGKCGAQVANGTRFCPNCGAKIAQQQQHFFEGVETRVGPRPSGSQPSTSSSGTAAAAAQKPGRSTLFFGG